MYSPAGSSVNAGKDRFWLVFLGVALGVAALALRPQLAPTAEPQEPSTGQPEGVVRPQAVSCVAAPALAALFVPPLPQLGRYEVCTTLEPLAAIASVRGWTVDLVAPLDAFGSGGPYDPSELARLYGGQTASVAHGWFKRGRQFESITLISPYPDAMLRRLLPGTLVVRFIICCS